jgi:hypothetical protein
MASRWALLVFTCLFSIASSSQDCSWAGRVYKDGQLLSTGGACQVCQAGKWIDKDVPCNQCTTASNPAVTNPEPSDKDCRDEKNGACQRV